MNSASLRPWLALRAIRGLGDGALCRLLEAVGSPEAVLDAPTEVLKQTGGLSDSVVQQLRRGPDSEIEREIDRELSGLSRLGLSVITYLDPDYPPPLKTIPDPPPLLYLSGTLEAVDRQAIAIVGSRRATQSGQRVTEELSKVLAMMGFTIVSGLARGIDASAHRGALAGGGRTLAVLGCGIDRTYPPEHKVLRRQIEESGGLLSELPLGAYPHAYHFPRRNRIISGLSLGVVVTEAAARSGSLITARLAAEQGREVFAVPGPVRQEHSRGPHGLIKQGAKLVETVEDIVEELMPQLDNDIKERLSRRPSAQEEVGPPLKEEEAAVYKLLSDQPTPIDELIVKAGLPASTVTTLLLSLELKGLLRRLPGSCLIRL